jgi:hypothetical protein
MWIHLNLYFKDYGKQDKFVKEDWKSVMSFLREVNRRIERYANRTFFLFENEPHLFFAIETTMFNVHKIKKIINSLDKPPIIERIGFSDNLKNRIGDEVNGEPALKFFVASSAFALYMASGDYKEGYEFNDAVKMLHCFCNMLGMDWNEELDFYMKCALHRGAREITYLDNNFKNFKVHLHRNFVKEAI